MTLFSGQKRREAWKASSITLHKYAVGRRINLAFPATMYPPKELSALRATTFEIVQLLPKEGPIWLYRVRDIATGQERVAAEQDIRTITDAVT